MLLSLLLVLGCDPDVNVTKHDVDHDNDGFDVEVDCDDSHATVNPDAAEVCDGVDNDCDGEMDEEPTDGAPFYADTDGDGAGDAATEITACAAPDGFVADAADCDDAEARAYPGNAEVCDGIDNDCDGDADSGATDILTFYADDDADGYGDASLTVATCDAPDGYVADGSDCDDADAAIHPDAAETDCTDPTDYDCDGSVAYADADGDGVPACEDCDDTDAARSPGLVEACDAADVDEDCDGAADDADDDPTGRIVWSPDRDADGYGDPSAAVVEACDQPAGYAADATDCDDDDGATNPGATEVCDASDVDEDCDGLSDDDDPSVSSATWSAWYRDLDGDTYGDPSGALSQCAAPAGYVADATDCDDAAADTNPAGAEICDAAGADEDCDGLANEDDASVTGTSDWYADGDADGYGAGAARAACFEPAGYAATSDDCDDADSAVHPGASELCDAADADEDCDGAADDSDASATGQTTWHRDQDGDTYGSASVTQDACDAPSGYVADATDCDDGSGSISPASAEVCENGVDDDCDGAIDDGCRLTGTYAAAEYDAKLYGEAGADQFGTSVAGGFDYDADGIDDLVVGAPGNDDGGPGNGAAYVYAGDVASGATAADADARLKLTGTAPYDDLGNKVWAVHDLDSDGDDEVVAYGDLTSTYVNLVLGSTASSGSVTSADYAAYTCDEVASGGDSDATTGDDDWLCAQQSYSTYTGRTYVYGGYGTAAGELRGESTNDYSGYALAGGQDFDGDGYDDYVIGAPGDDDAAAAAGAAYIVYAPISAASATSLASADVKLTGAAAADYFGYNVLSPGDMDGDGYADVLVGGERADTGAPDGGAIYFFSSPASGSASGADARVDAADGSDYLGNNDYCFMSAGDADGDGAVDLLVGSSYSDPTGSASGQAWLIYGPHSGTYDLASAYDARFQGEEAGDGFGVSGTMASDLDDDGLDDIVIGAPYGDGGASEDVGAIYVFYGR